MSDAPPATTDSPALSREDHDALRRIRAVNPDANPQALLPDIQPSRIPRHVAIIMDGNGRWAQRKGLPRPLGHKAGADAVRRALSTCSDLGIEALTLFSFSSENWKRPPDEVAALMALYIHNMRLERDNLVRHNIRFRQIGRTEDLPPEAVRELHETLDATAGCTGPTLCLAINYGSRDEIVHAARELARAAARGEINPDDIDEPLFASRLHTAGLPDPDLLIRTAGEMRLSNYLLWQLSYAELHVTQTLWPDFQPEDLLAAIREYASRHRRFGGL
ncbi:MAG: isoprenyl transferase [Phycisphaerales bacterium]